MDTHAGAVRLLRTSLFGELSLAPQGPSPGWHALELLLLLMIVTTISRTINHCTHITIVFIVVMLVQAKQRRPDHNWPMLYSKPLQTLISQRRANTSQQQIAPTASGVPPNVTAVQPAEDVANFSQLSSTAASKVWVALCRPYTLHSRGPRVVDGSKALVAIGHHAAHNVQLMTQQAGVVLYQGVHHSSAAVIRCLAAANTALGHAKQAAVTVISEFGHEVAEAGRMTAHDVSRGLGRMREDARSVAKSTNHALKYAGGKMQRGARHTLHQVSVK